jgi:hypothetical protein
MLQPWSDLCSCLVCWGISMLEKFVKMIMEFCGRIAWCCDVNIQHSLVVSCREDLNSVHMNYLNFLILSRVGIYDFCQWAVVSCHFTKYQSFKIFFVWHLNCWRPQYLFCQPKELEQIWSQSVHFCFWSWMLVPRVTHRELTMRWFFCNINCVTLEFHCSGIHFILKLLLLLIF